MRQCKYGELAKPYKDSKTGRMHRCKQRPRKGRRRKAKADK